MNLQLPPELADFVREQVAAGRYESEQVVIEQALQLLQERERRIEELRKEIQIGLEQLERGEYKVFDEDSLKEYLKELKAEIREKFIQHDEAVEQ